MHPDTQHSVGDITKVFRVVFAAFKEAMTLSLVLRLFKVIHFGGNRKRVYGEHIPASGQ